MPTTRPSASPPANSTRRLLKAMPGRVAAFWTANGEYLEEGGVELRSRDAIEKAFTELFKNQKPGKVEVEIQAIRFPSRDTAIEEGFLRQIPDGPGLPSSSLYQALHVREDGKWKIATLPRMGRCPRPTRRPGLPDRQVGRRGQRSGDEPFI